ncbi:MAG: GAF domain-containing protein [Bacteroidetes bacterium]|nr:GAF domain-containing protein [Bacteroidota bacterium]
MKKLKLAILALSHLWICSAQSFLQSGSQNIINYSPKEYSAFQQNWSVVQDTRGIMYFGNGSGLLEFDGSSWRLYPVPNKSNIFSLAIDKDGKIYAGAQADLGYFENDKSGKLIFHSLINFLPKDKRDFSDVWNTYILNGKVYFNTGNAIFIWDITKQSFHFIQSAKGFHTMFSVNGVIYVREWDKGLMVINNDQISLCPEGEQFSQEKIYGILPFPGEKGVLLIVTRTKGLLKYDGKHFSKIQSTANEFLKNNLSYLPGTVLSDGNILLGTLNGGAIVIDSSGNEVRRYNRENGIIDNVIQYTYQDRSGEIWLATSNGISSIDYSSPITYFDSRNNITTTPNDIIRHNNIIYTATSNGVYFLKPGNSNFQILKNSHNQSWSLAEMGADLLVGTSDGLFKIDAEQLSPIRLTTGNDYNINILKKSSIQPNRLFVGTGSGLWSVLYNGKSYTDEGQILNNPDQSTSISEDIDGSIWLGTFSSGLFRLSFNRDPNGKTLIKTGKVEHFDSKDGLQGGFVFIQKINGINYFYTPDSLYIFQENKKRFYSDTTDEIIKNFYQITQGNPINVFHQDGDGRIWIGSKGRLEMNIKKKDGQYYRMSAAFRSFADEAIYQVYSENKDIAWIGTGSGIIKYDFSGKKINSHYAALIRSITTDNDSIIYFGEGRDSTLITSIGFAHNSLKFRFSATSYEGNNANQYKTFLEGFDKSWTSWSKENAKEYTNLPPGKYTFKVIALNIQGIESRSDSYRFEILPPWYRTWWAWFIYGISFCLLAFLFINFQRKRVLSKERQRSLIREEKLKADAEAERHRNIELISEMGKDITSSLSIEHIIDTVYIHVNKLMDASLLGIGIINADKTALDFPATKRQGKTLPAYSYSLNDSNRPSSWCYNHKKEIFTNNFEQENATIIATLSEAGESEHSASVIYLPLMNKEKSIGVITAQSIHKNAYNDYHLNVLRTLATYTAVALDNADAYRTLKSTQAQLIQSEKMASLGELTAGIAHEIQNPLNFVNNFSDLNTELIREMDEEITAGNFDEVKAIAQNIGANEDKINHHGKRAEAIVKGMLLHSRSSSELKVPTDINFLCEEYIRLAYHGIRAKDKDFHTELKMDFDNTIQKINIIPQDIGRVLLNMLNNSFYACSDKQQRISKSQNIPSEKPYEPYIKITTRKNNQSIEILVQDNGTGIPEEILDKIFQPFFTTKPAGKGTGLGLSLAYDIVKVHNGYIKVENDFGEGCIFIISLPII